MTSRGRGGDLHRGHPASATMVVEVLDVFHLPGLEEGNLVYGLTKSYTKTGLPMKRPGLYEYPARQTQRSRQLDRFLCARHVCRADGLRGTVPPNQREGNRRQRHHWQQWRLEETEGRLGTQRERTDVGLESGYVRLKWEHEANDVEVV